ncbi:glycine-rich domain-containing protein [Chitinolyticbacter meiyuanensis]|uniref:glycine-rich domain-containing protein n=1 Tax=Chitinolyticbacter meiyuanensis TaxID=682798 RepID=UPI0011E5E547|nr:hypothetical protein [Chitinolyticbacter meiyuanensis]
MLLVASYYLWRALARRKQRQRVGSINGYLFPSAIRAKVQQHHAASGLDAAALLKVEAALRQFFRINGAAGKKRVAMPSQLVDDYWHEFILHTREYQRFCKGTLGRFLHHTPAGGISTQSRQQQAIQRAWVLACRDEGINPQRADRLPLLFGIDALFGIAGGYHYTLQCGERADGSSAAPFCGSDLGTSCASDASYTPSSSDSSSDYSNNNSDDGRYDSDGNDTSSSGNDSGCSSSCGSSCGGGGSD